MPSYPEKIIGDRNSQNTNPLEIRDRITRFHENSRETAKQRRESQKL